MELLRFLAAVVLAFYIPGNLLVRKIDLPDYSKIGLSVTLGIVLWGIQGFVFGFAGIRFATYIYLALTILVWSYFNRNLKINLVRLKIDWMLLAILTAGIIAHLSAIWFMGSISNGYLFCCRGVPDDIYHLALTNQLVKNVPPFEPGAAGIIVKNYHYWSDLIMADTIRIFGTDLVATVYKFFPILLSILLAGAVASFANLLNLGKIFARWLGLFVFFSGDILYLLTYINTRILNFDVGILDDATKLLAGPPRSFSIVIAFWAICLLVIWIKKRSALLDLMLALVFASLAGFKLYTNIFALAGLTFMSAYYFWKRDYRSLVMPILAVMFSFLIYLPVNSTGNSLTLNFPWIFRESLAKTAYGLVNLELARRIFVEDGKFLRSFLIDLQFTLLYFIFVFGTSLLALFPNRKSLTKLPVSLNIFLIGAILATAFLGFASSSKIGGANTIQFAIALPFFLAIYAALAVTDWQEKLPAKLRLGLVLVVVVLTIPRAIHDTAANFLMASKNDGFVVTSEELAALAYLRNQPNKDSLILLDPNWVKNETALHISFLANKPLYLAGYTGYLEDHQIVGITQRLETNRLVFSSTDPRLVYDFLDKNGVKFIYLTSASQLNVGNLSGKVSPVYQNPKVKVLSFQK